MGTEDAHERWSADTDVLAQVGQALLAQDTRVSVRIPVELADAAVAAWRREDEREMAEPESAEQQRVRDGAATLALIGMSITERGVVDGVEVTVDLGAWEIGNAFRAADHANLLGPTTSSNE